ncbi:MAG: class F sortase [Actinomycetota bacterium]|nr:class F sortase [Actinomycetota bacterium]
MPLTRVDAPTRVATTALAVLAVLAVLAGTVGLVADQRHRATGAPPATDIGVVSAAATPSAATTSGPSETGGLLSTHSTELGAQRANVAAPTSVTIPRLHLRATTRPAGLAADNRTLDLPPSARAVVWWAYGATPGAKHGTVLLAGHVSWNGRAGALAGLGKLRVGDQVTVRRADGELVRYDVTGRRRVPKMSLEQLGLFATAGAPRLVLVTCGGPFDAARHSYQDNVVVQARPA